MFDSTLNKPHRQKYGFFFQLGGGQVIGGWDIGFANMKVGEKAKLVCKYPYAYGEHGMPEAGIPPRATLEFEVELLGCKFMNDQELEQINAEVAALRR